MYIICAIVFCAVNKRSLKMLSHLYVYIILSALLSTIPVIESDDWKYPELSEEKEDKNRDEDFIKWGGLCDTGKRQSPINLRVKNAILGRYNDSLQMTSFKQKIGRVSLTNNGHTIKMFNFGPEILIKGGPLKKSTYKLEQIHFHWWSEHTIDSQRFPFETHIVFRNIRYNDMTRAAKNRDGVTVIGILYYISFDRNNFLDEVITKLDVLKSFEKRNQMEQLNVESTINDIIGLSLDEYFTYNGSLTTPNCGEAVTWIIIGKILPITIDQVNAFKAVEYDLGKRLRNNFRSTQKVNNRAVIRVTKKSILNSSAQMLTFNSFIKLWTLTLTLIIIYLL